MRLRLIAEARYQKKDKHFFDYRDLSKDMWHKKIKETQEEHGVSFDLENDYDIGQREIEIPQDEWEHFKNCKFRCELYSACGDWQNPVLYFRCQLREGYARDLHDGDHFIFIPSKDEGNINLIKDGSKWRASEDDDYKKSLTKEQRRPNEYKAWQGLKRYLTKLVKDEITAIHKERRDRGDQPGDG